ncbi:MAG TPA: adenylosuccinate lyase [Nitrososphaeraceae archaeon]|jgi:adenylosuccinate lyase
MPILPIDSGRYGSTEIRKIFEENSRLKYQLEFETSVAMAQAQIRMIPKDAAEEINNAVVANLVSLERIKELETISEHDTAAVIEALSEQCSSTTRPWIHYGLTSSDVVDTSISMQIRDVLVLVESKILTLTETLLDKASKFASQPAVGRTHGQHASIISFGLKFAVWSLELAKHLERIEEGKKRYLICKTLGVVGTGSLMGERALEVQNLVSKKLCLFPIDAGTQVVSRERLAEIQFIIALVGCTLDKIATEIRNLQRTEIGELSEPFKTGQMGSSAVPVKRNPIKSERVSSLARLLRPLVIVSMENIPLWHERDLTNSANERFTIPMGSILIDEMLSSMIKVISELRVNRDKITANINLTDGKIYAEFVLDELIKKGIPRFEAYRDVQRIAFSETGLTFVDAIRQDSKLANLLNEHDLARIFNPHNHLAASIKIITNVSKLVNRTRRKMSFNNYSK